MKIIYTELPQRIQQLLSISIIVDALCIIEKGWLSKSIQHIRKISKQIKTKIFHTLLYRKVFKRYKERLYGFE